MILRHACPLQTPLLRWTHFSNGRSVQRAVAECVYVRPKQGFSFSLWTNTKTEFKTTNYTSLFLFFLAIACFELYTKILTCFSLWLKYLTITQKTARVRKMIPSQVKNTSSYCFWRYLLLAVQRIVFLHEFFLLQVIIETASGRHEVTGRTILNYSRVSICRLFLSRHLKITERGRRK